MVYTYKNSTGRTYYLLEKTVTLQNGRPQRIFYFAPQIGEGETVAELPPGARVVENARNGLPYLKTA